MSKIRNSRMRQGAAVAAGTIVGLGMLPGLALADHGGDWLGCYETDTAVFEEPTEQPAVDTPHAEMPDVACSGPVPAYGSGGASGEGGGVEESGPRRDSPRSRLLAAGCGVPGGGAAGSGAGYWNDSGTADLVDSAPAGLDEMGVMAAAGAGWTRAAVAGCPRPVALIGGTGAGVVAPNRIDAGGGGAAAAGWAAGPALAAAIAGLGAAVGVRRRRRP